MADDPLFGFKPVAAAPDPLLGFKPTAAAASSDTDLGSTPIWNKPADASWGDYMLAHLAKALPSGALDPHVNANEAVLLGSGLSGGLSGFIPGMRERTAQAEAETPIGNRIAIQGAGYLLGPGKLGVASKLGEALGGGYLAGIGGAAGEGALASGVGEAGAGGSTSDVVKAAGIGALTGGGGGALGGVVGHGGVLPAAPTADALTAAAKKEYAPLTNVLYDATKEVHPAIDPIDAQNALRDWSGYKWNDATKTKGEINTLLNKPQLSANDLQQSQSYLKGIASDGRSDPNDALYAAHYAKKLQGVLEDATPQTGVPQNWTPPAMPSVKPPATGQGTMTVNGQPYNYANGQWTPPSFAATKKAAGDALHAKAQDVGRLDDWVAKAAVPQGPDVGSQASSYLRSGQGQQFAPPGSSGYDALSTLAKTSAGPNVGAAPSAFDFRHLAHPLVGAAVGGALGVGSEHDFDPAHIAEAMILGGALGYGAHKGIPAIQRSLQQASQGRAIDAARVALGTGAQQSPVLPDAAFRNAVRALIFGQGAGANLPGQ